MECISQLWGGSGNRQNKHINIINEDTMCRLEGDTYDRIREEEGGSGVPGLGDGKASLRRHVSRI